MTTSHRYMQTTLKQHAAAFSEITQKQRIKAEMWAISSAAIRTRIDHESLHADLKEAADALRQCRDPTQLSQEHAGVLHEYRVKNSTYSRALSDLAASTKASRAASFCEEEPDQALAALVDNASDQTCRAAEELYYETTPSRWKPTELVSPARQTLPNLFKRIWVGTLVVAAFAIMAVMLHYSRLPEFNIAAIAAGLISLTWLVESFALRKSEIARIQADTLRQYDKAEALADRLCLPSVSMITFELLMHLALRAGKLPCQLDARQREIRSRRMAYHNIGDIAAEFNRRQQEYPDLLKQRDAIEQSNPELLKAASSERACRAGTGEWVEGAIFTVSRYKKLNPHYRKIVNTLDDHAKFLKENSNIHNLLDQNAMLFVAWAAPDNNVAYLAHALAGSTDAERWAKTDLRDSEEAGEEAARWYRVLLITLIPALLAVMGVALINGHFIVLGVTALIGWRLHNYGYSDFTVEFPVFLNLSHSFQIG